MPFVADFHLHSHFSRATSKACAPEGMEYWARLKGVTVLGTGDFTHPGWLQEIEEKLEPAEPGLFKLKQKYQKPLDFVLPFAPEARFMLTTEISNIYTKNGKVRKVHNLIFAPDFATVKKINRKLTQLNFNLLSDGRPILGLDSRDLLEIALDASPEIFFVPAHIWTPWFSVLGSKSGFDSMAECFTDLTPQIFAVETGLSSDPPMNAVCSFLDQYTLISNSDAHSPEKIGREANLFQTDLNYAAILQAMRTGNSKEFLGTLEFFPEEGKYHFDGHRQCEVCFNPTETLQKKGLCPVCGKPVVVGVLTRVAALADRLNPSERPRPIQFESLIPLKEIIGEILGVQESSKKVAERYFKLLAELGPELRILRETPLPEIAASCGGALLAEAIRRMRRQEVILQSGYDGEYGKIKLFQPAEKIGVSKQDSLFEINPSLTVKKRIEKRPLLPFDLATYQHLRQAQNDPPETLPVSPVKVKTAKKSAKDGLTQNLASLNQRQQKAVEHLTGPALVLAGPGTGKTRVLTLRLAHLIQKHKIPPPQILAVTFTKKAAQEMRARLNQFLQEDLAAQVKISTLHAFGLEILKKYATFAKRQNPLAVLTPADQKKILTRKLGCSADQVKDLLQNFARMKQGGEISRSCCSPRRIEPQGLLEGTDSGPPQSGAGKARKTFLDSLSGIGVRTRSFQGDSPEIQRLFQAYEDYLQTINAVDFDDLIWRPLRILNQNPQIAVELNAQYQWILIDEYQDLDAAQYQLVRALCPQQDANLFAIGDPNQAIYGFRGADVKFIRQFSADYPQTKIYQLEQSYRCPENVLKASADILALKHTLKGRDETVKIKINAQASEWAEAEFVAAEIERLVGGTSFYSFDSRPAKRGADPHRKGKNAASNYSFAEIVVLCRVKAQMEVLKKVFAARNLPVKTVADTPFFHQEPFAALLDLLQLLVQPENQFLQAKLRERQIQPQNFLQQDFFSAQSVTAILQKLRAHYFTEAMADFQDNWENFLDLAQNFQKPEDFLAFTGSSQGIDAYQPQTEKVSLMTLHAAKGLEFPCVFIVGLEEGILPYALKKNQTSDVEEEQRLLYVGMTRAQELLYLSYARQRFWQGQNLALPKSSLLERISAELFEFEQIKEKQKRTKPQQDEQNLTLF